MKPSSQPSDLNPIKGAIALTAALIGCHSDLRIKDTSVEFAVYSVASKCAAVRALAKEKTGDADREMQSTSGTDAVRESCQCAGGACEYVRGKKVETMCASGPCTQYDLTEGTLMYFDAGEAGVVSQATLSHSPIPDATGVSKDSKSEVLSVKRGSGIFSDGTCEFATTHFDKSLMKVPRIAYTNDIGDCLAAERLVSDSFERISK